LEERDLLDEQTYHKARAEESLWRWAHSARVSRKRVLQILAGATGAPLAQRAAPRSQAQDAASGTGFDVRGETGDYQQYSGWFAKPTPDDYFISHGHSREMRWDKAAGVGFTIPNEMFYLQNHFPTPHIDPSTWTLNVFGDGASNPVTFSYNDILSMPSTTITRSQECGENGRVFFVKQFNMQFDGAQWGLGAIGVAEWTGVRLSEILQRAGITPGAVDVMPIGLDAPHNDLVRMVARPMPVSKAMAEDTLLVYQMNGEILPPDHGYPLRAFLPGWTGIANIKWVGSIQVSETPLLSLFNTEYGVMIGPDYPITPPSTVGMPATFRNVKSSFELTWNAVLPAGTTRLTGRSWSGYASMAKVEVSTDGGQTYQPVDLSDPNPTQTWVRWSLMWNATPGRYNLRARATDSMGHVQPEMEKFNEHGYSCGGVVDHPVTVF
jgi:DMSO/TMAO reductase YedYZ molybdopterin-dependent catalytic subunit